MGSAMERMKLNLIKGILIVSIIVSGQFKSCSTQVLTKQNVMINKAESCKVSNPFSV
jgi:hypothetical protein